MPRLARSIAWFSIAICALSAVIDVADAKSKRKGGASAPIATEEGGEGEAMPDAGDVAPQEEVQSRPVPPKTGLPAPVTLSAFLSEGGASIVSDVVWRIYDGHPGQEGGYKLLNVVREPRPTLEMKPGEYLINVSHGRANLTRRVGVWPEKAVTEDFVVNAGGMRLAATLAKAPIAAEHLLKFEVFSDAQDQFGNRQKILSEVRPGIVYRVNSGLYHIVSTYGDGNSTIASDIVIEPGKITDAVVDHDAGKITFKLVQRKGGEAVADTHWILQNASGEIVKESAGAFPTHILAAGDYHVIANHSERQYGGNFSVAAGETKLVEVLMQ